MDENAEDGAAVTDARPAPESPGPSSPPEAPVARTSLVGRVLRLSLVLAVLATEFAFLMWAYHLDDAVGERAVHVARARTLSDGLQTGVTLPVLRRDLDAAVADLVASDAPGAPAVAAAARDDLASSQGRAAFASAVQDTAERVAAQQRSRDWVVAGIVLAMFLVVCVGWFTWFARLARRHREVQRELTRHEEKAAGERRLTALVHNSADVIAVLEDDSAMSFLSPSTTQVLGRTPAELVGRRFVDVVLAEDREVVARHLTRTDGVEQPLSLRVPHPDGRVLSVEGTLKDLRHDPAVLGWVLTVRDVTERQALERDLAHRVFHDALTGLANRQLLADRLTHALQRRGTTLGAVSVLVVDLDDFKLVNDSLGLSVGDQVLLQVAQRIEAVLRPGDTAARLGGDEFAVLLDGTDATEAGAVSRRLLAAIEEPIGLEDRGATELRLRASIGVATLASGAETDAHLLRNADVALYDAKQRTRGGFTAYDPSRHTRALDLLQQRIGLADAITGGELVLLYQPTVTLATQRVSGFEALVRWQHPERGLLAPIEFIPLAEETGLVVPLGGWVLEEACRAAVRMQAGDLGPTMAVNVAVRQLSDPGFGPSVTRALQASGLPAHRLVLEITETVMLDDLDSGVAVLTGLRELGIRVAIDDFGTGYSSLAQLAALPVDVLKVDKSFVDRLGGERADASVVEAILTMSAAMDLVSVAEGVEDVEQARWLREHAATYGQGYLWSRPVPLEEAIALLRDGVRSIGPVRGEVARS